MTNKVTTIVTLSIIAALGVLVWVFNFDAMSWLSFIEKEEVGKFQDKIAVPDKKQFSKIPKVSPTATDKEKAEFAKEVHEIAQLVNTIEINRCEFKPGVIRVKEGESIIFDNKDEVEHKVRVYTVELVLPPHSAKTQIAKFEKGTGIYGLSCDGDDALGFLEVEHGSQ